MASNPTPQYTDWSVDTHLVCKPVVTKLDLSWLGLASNRQRQQTTQPCGQSVFASRVILCSSDTFWLTVWITVMLLSPSLILSFTQLTSSVGMHMSSVSWLIFLSMQKCLPDFVEVTKADHFPGSKIRQHFVHSLQHSLPILHYPHHAYIVANNTSILKCQFKYIHDNLTNSNIDIRAGYGRQHHDLLNSSVAPYTELAINSFLWHIHDSWQIPRHFQLFQNKSLTRSSCK